MRWSEQVATTTGVPAWDAEEMDLVLDLVREVAHGVERRYGPLSAFSIGVAIGQRLGADADDPQVRRDPLRAMATALTEAARSQHKD